MKKNSFDSPCKNPNQEEQETFQIEGQALNGESLNIAPQRGIGAIVTFRVSLSVPATGGAWDTPGRR